MQAKEGKISVCWCRAPSTCADSTELWETLHFHHFFPITNWPREKNYFMASKHRHHFIDSIFFFFFFASFKLITTKQHERNFFYFNHNFFLIVFVSTLIRKTEKLFRFFFFQFLTKFFFFVPLNDIRYWGVCGCSKSIQWFWIQENIRASISIWAEWLNRKHCERISCIFFFLLRFHSLARNKMNRNEEVKNSRMKMGNFFCCFSAKKKSFRVI